MASYRQNCLHCGALVDRDVRLCPACGSRSPFGYQCPSCLRAVERGQTLCAGCGRPLYVACPHCGQNTFADERCERCGGSLLVLCGNRRCGALQFFQNGKCTVCGKKLKAKINGTK